MKHFQFGSSTAARTDACPAWVAESASLPKPPDSEYAKEGTAIHKLLEDRCLDDGYDFNDALGKPVEGVTITAAHIDLARDMWAACEEVLTRHGATEWEAETTGKAAEDIGGTLDVIATAPKRGILIDFKSGRGVQVSPVNNKQILFATAVCEIESSAADLLSEHDSFVGVIIQPGRGGEVEAREWEFTREQVDLFWAAHLDNIALARAGESTPVAGDHCKFCPANGVCDATTGNLLRMQQLDPEDLDVLKWALDHVESVKATIAAVEAQAYRQLELGVPIPGWKLVAKRAGNTTWKDEEAAIKTLRRKFKGKRNIVTEKLLSPAQLTKKAKAQGLELDLSELTHRPPSSGSTLAREDDARPAQLSSEAFGAALASVQ